MGLMFVLLLSIICIMALYMIYGNLLIHILSISEEGERYVQHFSGYWQTVDPRDALLAGGHPLLTSFWHNLVPLFVMLIVAALAVWLGNVRPSLCFLPLFLLPFSFWGLLLFPLHLYLTYNIIITIFLLIPGVVLSVIIARRDFFVLAKGIRKSTKNLMLLILAPLPFSPFIILIFGYEQSGILSTIFYFHYMIIFIACAIGILRLERGTETMLKQPKFIMISLAPAILISLLILGSQQIAWVIWRVIQWISMSIIVPLVVLFVRALEWFFSLFYTHDPTSALPIYSNGHADYSFQNDPYGVIPAIPSTEGIHIYILAGILTIIITTLVYKMLKGIFRRKQVKVKEGIIEERRNLSLPQKSKQSEKHRGNKHGFFAPREPGLAVRYYYRQFLQLCIAKGFSFKKGNTSREIFQMNKEKFSKESMVKLRELYIKARYSEKEIEKSEAERARELLKRL